jgi:mRNA interferase MazF
MCPITNKVKGYPFETPLPAGLPISGVVLADHLRSLDWQSRKAERIGVLPSEVVSDVLAKIFALLEDARA